MPDPKTGIAPYDCDGCRDPDSQVYQTEDTRRSWHCGFLPREEWTTQYHNDPNAFDGAWEMPDGSACDQCPGYVARLRSVREAIDATWALRRGVLTLYHREPSALLLDALRVADHAFSQREARMAANAGKQ